MKTARSARTAAATAWPVLIRGQIHLIGDETQGDIGDRPCQFHRDDRGGGDVLDLSALNISGRLPRRNRRLEGSIGLIGQQRAERHPVTGRKSGNDGAEGVLSRFQKTRSIEAGIDRAQAAQLLTER